MSNEKINMRLHYWDGRGRIQAVRYMLADNIEKHPNIEFNEELELLSARDAWLSRKEDPKISGPTRNLPVLHWNNKQILSQTLPIAQFLARKLSLYGKPTGATDVDMDVHMALIDGIVSCAYTDVISTLLVCIWMSTDLHDDTKPEYRMVRKIAGDLKTLDGVLKQSSTKYFYDQQDPTIADYFVFEAYTFARDVCSVKLTPSNQCETLKKHEETMKARPGLAKYFEKKLLYDIWTASPTEATWRKKMAEKN